MLGQAADKTFAGMLALDDPYWSQLHDAYGLASGIPELLRTAAQSPAPLQPDQEPWFSLWSALCHQGDVYTASYAAVPHLVRTSLTTLGAVGFSFFLLPTSIEVARAAGRGPPLPERLAASYEHAIHELSDSAFARKDEAWSEDFTKSVTAALAVAKGHHALAEALMNLDSDLIARINNFDWN